MDVIHLNFHLEGMRVSPKQSNQANNPRQQMTSKSVSSASPINNPVYKDFTTPTYAQFSKLLLKCIENMTDKSMSLGNAISSLPDYYKSIVVQIQKNEGEHQCWCVVNNPKSGQIGKHGFATFNNVGYFLQPIGTQVCVPQDERSSALFVTHPRSDVTMGSSDKKVKTYQFKLFNHTVQSFIIGTGYGGVTVKGLNNGFGNYVKINGRSLISVINDLSDVYGYHKSNSRRYLDGYDTKIAIQGALNNSAFNFVIPGFTFSQSGNSRINPWLYEQAPELFEVRPFKGSYYFINDSGKKVYPTMEGYAGTFSPKMFAEQGVFVGNVLCFLEAVKAACDELNKVVIRKYGSVEKSLEALKQDYYKRFAITLDAYYNSPSAGSANFAKHGWAAPSHAQSYRIKTFNFIRERFNG